MGGNGKIQTKGLNRSHSGSGDHTTGILKFGVHHTSVQHIFEMSNPLGHAIGMPESHSRILDDNPGLLCGKSQSSIFTVLLFGKMTGNHL